MFTYYIFKGIFCLQISNNLFCLFQFPGEFTYMCDIMCNSNTTLQFTVNKYRSCILITCFLFGLTFNKAPLMGFRFLKPACMLSPLLYPLWWFADYVLFLHPYHSCIAGLIYIPIPFSSMTDMASYGSQECF